MTAAAGSVVCNIHKANAQFSMDSIVSTCTMTTFISGLAQLLAGWFLRGMAEIHVTIPPHRSSKFSAMHASSIFPSSTQHLQEWLVQEQEQEWQQERGRGREWERDLVREWQTPWDPHQANCEWDGLAYLVECLKSPRRYGQREASPQ